MKTKEQIGKDYIKERFNENRIMKKSKWYSKEELKEIISELTLTKYKGNPEGYINAQYLKERLELD